MDSQNNKLYEQYPMLRILSYGSGDCFVYDAKANFGFILDNEAVGLLISFLLTEDKHTAIEMCNFKDKEKALVLCGKFDELSQAGLFMSGGMERISPEAYDVVKDLVDKYFETVLLRKFVLEITEDCNFRCTYCRNTLNTEFRKHSKVAMSYEVAQKGIDYYFNRYVDIFMKLSEEKKQLLLETVPPTLSWYGGEPFMNFRLILETIDYFKTLDWDKFGIDKKYLQYVCNTNLSIMNDEILETLVSNNILLQTSLDGPKEEHDKCRVFPDGQGTFDVAFANLLKIRDFNEEYFKRKVSILCVASDKYDHEKCVDFFTTAGLIGQCSFFDESYNDCIIRDACHKLEEREKSKIEEFQFWKNEIDNYRSLSENKDLMAFLKFLSIETDKPHGINKESFFITCPMGVDNIMIGVNGDMHICHKTDGSMPFGNVNDKQFDTAGITNLYVEYGKNTNKGCNNCWMFRFCGICGAMRINKGLVTNPETAECDIFRLECESQLKAYFYAAEFNPKIIDDLIDYKNNRRNYISVIDINTY